MRQRWFIHYFENGQFQYSEETGRRIAYEAQALINEQGKRFYDHVLTYRKADLGADYLAAHNTHFQHKRGAGYWVWKPRIVQLTLARMAEGDELLYADSGCELRGLPTTLFQLLDQQDIVSFHIPHYEKLWTKADLAQHIGSSAEHLNSLQRMATFFILRKTPQVVALIDEWVKIASDLHLIDDSPSVLPNDSSFQEHRHDQSIWSLLVKKAGYISYSQPAEILDSKIRP